MRKKYSNFAPIMKKPHFIIDFDSTFTRVEALDVLAEIVLSHTHPKKRDKILQQIQDIPNHSFWSVRQSLKAKMLETVLERSVRSSGQRGQRQPAYIVGILARRSRGHEPRARPQVIFSRFGVDRHQVPIRGDPW